MSKHIERWEHRAAILLNRVSVLDVIAIQMADYQTLTGYAPNRIFINQSVRTALAKELINNRGWDPIKAASNPIYLEIDPRYSQNCLCFFAHMEHYLIVQSTGDPEGRMTYL